jgi:ABC-2 type transport system permease protein/lipopolysaccharide transport system permease protein
MIIYVLVITLFRIQPFPGLFLFLPGMFLILLNGVWIAMLIGLLNARSRDLGQMIPYAMRLFFFVTPIIWYAESAQGIRRLFVVYNPFYYLLEILRAPLLGDIPRPEVWGVALVITALGWAVALPLYARWRRQIAFWV